MYVPLFINLIIIAAPIYVGLLTKGISMVFVSVEKSRKNHVKELNEKLFNLAEFKNVKWDVFSKHNSKLLKHKNITIQPVDSDKFTTSMASSSGVLCGAGFETPAEALFLGKKLMVIPMKNQYEQHLNAAALQAMKVPVIKSLKPKYKPLISEWLENGQKIAVNYPDITQEIIDMIVKKHKADTTFDSDETLFI